MFFVDNVRIIQTIIQYFYAYVYKNQSVIVINVKGSGQLIWLFICIQVSINFVSLIRVLNRKPKYPVDIIEYYP